MTGESARLLPDTDYLLERDKAAVGTAITASNGGDPLVDPPAFGYPKDMHVEIERRLHFEQDRNKKMNEQVFANPQSGWGEIQSFNKEIIDTYKKQNESVLIKQPKNAQEAQEQAYQLRPLVVDPNKVANIRQLAVKMDQQMKAVDPRTSFWTDPRTKHIADWLNRESGPGQAGYIQSGDQPVEMTNEVLGVNTHIPGLGRAATAAWQGIEGIGSASTSVVHGLWDLGRKSISAMGGPDIGPSYPTNYITTEDGKLVSNGGKVPSIMDGIVMTWAHAAGQNVEKHAAEAGRAEQWEQANRAGLGGIITSVSRLGGELVGMAPGFGAAAALGKATLGGLTTKGLQALGTLRLAKGVQQSDRALKLIKTMSDGMSSAAGMAGYEAVTQGRAEGYGAAYLHGLMMAPVLMTLGALGKKAEWFANNRLNMPGAASRLVAGALEGAGFGAVETTMPQVLPAAWGFIRDPNQSTFEAYMKNMLAFGLVKMTTGHTAVATPEQVQLKRGIGRAQFAEKVARGEATDEEIAGAPVPDAAKLTKLGQASMRSREGKTVEERTQAQAEMRQHESDLDVAEMGKGPAEAVVEHVGEKVRKGSLHEIAAEERAARDQLPKDTVTKTPRQLEEEGQLAVGRALEHGRSGPAKTTAKGPLGEIVQERLNEDYEATKQRMEATQGEVKTGEKPVDKKQLSYRDMRSSERALAAKAESEASARDKRVTMEGNRGTSAEAVPEVRAEARPEGTELLPDVSRHGHAALSEAAAIAGGGQEKGEREELRQGLPAKGQAAEAAVPELRQHEGADASRGLPEAAPGDVAVPGVPSEASPELEARRGVGSPSGVRGGAQSMQLPPTTQVQATPGTKPVQARDIFAEMEGRPGRAGFQIPFTAKRVFAKEGDPVQTAMRGGKIGRPGVAGIFKIFENLSRTEEGRDLVAASHEWSHDMQRHMISPRGGRSFAAAAMVQERQAMASDPRMAGEIATVLKDYPGANNLKPWERWAETWAEWHARNLLGEVGLDQKLPALSDFMRKWLAAPEQARLRPQYGRIQDQLYRYNAQGSRGRLAASVVHRTDAPTETQKATKPGLLARIKHGIETAMFDDMSKLKRSQDRWLKASGRRAEDVSIIEDPARLADALAMTADKTSEYFTRVGITIDNKFVPGLEPILNALKGDPREFERYVVAVRSMELYDKGKPVQLPPQDYAESIKSLTAENPEFPDAAKRLKAWTDALVDYVAQSGNLETEVFDEFGNDVSAAQRIKDSYVVYVPFFRAIEGPAQHGQGRGVAERGTGLAKIKGSTYEIEDPLVALQQVARSMIAKAHQNQVMTALYKMAQGQEAGGLATIVKRDMVPTEHPLRRVLDAIEKGAELPGDAQHALESVFEALRQQDALDPQMVTLFAQKVIPTGERSVVAYTPRLDADEINALVAQGAHRQTLENANNKLQWLELDTGAYESLMGIDKMPMLPEKAQPVLAMLRAPAVVTRLFATGVNVAFAASNAVRDMMSAPLFAPHGKGFRPLGGFIDFWKGAAIYHRDGKIRELYEEAGVKTSSFWSEARQREMIGERQSIYQKTRRVIERAEELVATPENYIRIAAFKDAYEGAKAAGKTEFEARMLALEAGKEITVNFARSGWLARAFNQFTPYFNAGMQGQRKLWGNLLGGVDSKSDAQRAAVQRATIMNGIANITVPSMFFWWLHKDEDWYQDLPEWRKLGFINTKIFGQVISVPLPFEAGVLFGGIPKMIGDMTFGSNPASVSGALKGLIGPYSQIGSMVPAFIKPIVEVGLNHNLFTGRPLTPEWVSRSNPPEEQATFYTTETAKVLSKALNGFLSPIEIEAIMGGYTAGSAVTAMQVADEITGMKDHPGLAANPFNRFVKQTPHGQSSFVDQLYSLGAKLEQREDTLEPEQKNLKRRVDHAKTEISRLRKQYRAGDITKEEAERQSYELARPLVEESK